MGLVHDPAERAARAEQKRRLILRFLRTEIWTTYSVLAELLQIAHATTLRETVARMERDGEVVVETVQIGMTNYKIIGVTSHGQAMAWRPGRPDSGEPLVEKHYERGRVGVTTAHHTLDLQRLRIRLSRAGWKDWANTDRVPPEERANAQVKSKSYKRPDALARHPRLGMVAVECERNVKTRKRYQAIIESHLAGMKQGKFSAAVWACPTPEIAAAVRRILDSIEYLKVLGQSVRLGADERAKLIVTDYESIVSL